MKPIYRQTALIIAVTVAGFALILWSWNTLAGLLGLPGAGARHAVAALVLLATLRLAIGGRSRRRYRHGAGLHARRAR